MRVGLITLGCDKNTVDNEYLAGLLQEKGLETVFLGLDDPVDTVEVAVVTTCGFILDAKEQSVQTIVRMVESKETCGKPERIYVSGCLSQRYGDGLLEELPELDGIVGVGQFAELAEMIADHPETHGCFTQAKPLVEIKAPIKRVRSSDQPYAFLKISDGCDHACAFCSIPLMKGALRSVPMDILLEEAKTLLSQGVKELVLVAQDTAAYGFDWDRTRHLPALLRELAKLDGDFWIRLMYCYPAGITDELIEVMTTENKVVPYLDSPMQHFDPDMLIKMRRPGRRAAAASVVARLRERIPEIVLRTTVITGFPGESYQAHQRMLQAVEDLSFHWLGAFPYSPEEDTVAVDLPRKVGKKVKERRWSEIMEAQAAVTAERNEARVGTKTRVLIEEYDAERRQWVGRSPAEAPEVDGTVYVNSEKLLKKGCFVEVIITDAENYDVVAKIV